MPTPSSRGERVLSSLHAHVTLRQPHCAGAAIAASAAAQQAEPAVVVDVFFDYNSADAYLGLDAIAELEHDYHVKLNWVPFRVREPEFGLCGADGEPDVSAARPHWQRKHPQLWREAKEYAELRGLALKGMPVMQDTATALLGMLWVAEHSRHSLPAYHAVVFDAVWGASSGSVDIAATATVEGFLAGSGCVGPFHTFRAFLSRGVDEGLLDKIDADAKQSPGVFGVPTLHYDGGTESETKKPVERLYVKEVALSLLRHRLHADGLARAERSPSPDVPFARRTLEAVSGSLPPPQQPPKVITAYVDLKSPYAFLALEPMAELEREFNVVIDWLPFTLDIPSYLGSARVGKTDNVVKAGSADRSPAQWNAVRYAYMDCRRYGTRRQPEPLTIFGTEKIWDSSLAAIAMLWVRRLAMAKGVAPLARAEMWASYNEAAWPTFWKRELDIDDPAVLENVIRAAGLPADGFAAYIAEGVSTQAPPAPLSHLDRTRMVLRACLCCQGEGRAEFESVLREAIEERGVFGVPTFCADLRSEDESGVGEELSTYWGREHLNLIRLRLYEQGYAKQAGVVVDAPHVWVSR